MKQCGYLWFCCVNICEPHMYVCWFLVNTMTMSWLSSKHTSGKLVYLNHLNNMVLCLLTEVSILARVSPKVCLGQMENVQLVDSYFMV